MTLAAPGMAQTKRIGILPFDDAAGVGPELGAQVALFIRAELLKTRKAVELGRENEVDFVVIGTILEAESTSSESGIDGISFDKGSVGADISTDWAGYNTDSYKGEGPNGKALREAVEKLVKWMVKKI